MSRGIVIAAGGERLLSQAYVTIGVLRFVGCELPIEIWRSDSEAGHSLEERIVQRYGRDITFARTEADGWQIKAAALRFAAFDEALLLDADNIVTRDPSYLFDAPGYLQTGALFWSDLLDIRADAPAWEFFGLQGQSIRAFESGQILLDRHRCADALEHCWRMIMQPETFGHLYGDKDVWLLSWMKVGKAFTRCQHSPAVTSHIWWQHDLDGLRLFQHRRRKLTFDGRNERMPGFEHELICFALAQELRERVYA